MDGEHFGGEAVKPSHELQQHTATGWVSVRVCSIEYGRGYMQAMAVHGCRYSVRLVTARGTVLLSVLLPGPAALVAALEAAP